MKQPKQPRYMRRSMFISGATLAGGVALAACGAPAGSTGSGDTQKTVAPASLNFATLYKEDPSWQLSRKQMADFESQFPTIKVQTDWITGSTGDYLKKVQTYLAGGSQPDVLYIHYLQTAIFGAPGVLLDLTKYTGQDKAFNTADLIEGVADHFRFRGKPVGVPWYSGPHTLLFNKTLFQRVGLKNPEELEKEGKWTWNSFREAAQKLTTGAPGSPDRTIGVAGISDGSIRLGRWERFVWQNGGELFNKEVTKSQFNSPAGGGVHLRLRTAHEGQVARDVGRSPAAGEQRERLPLRQGGHALWHRA